MKSMARTQSPPPDAVTMTFHVRYAETDAMRVAHHANYFVWFEMGRAAFCRERGIDYGDMETTHGLFLPIVEAHCRYVAPARYDDFLTLAVWSKEITKRTLRFGYLLTRDGTLLAEGETYQILVDANGRPRTLPPDLAAKMQ
jgi:acyl-CoA thioester hydrolase